MTKIKLSILALIFASHISSAQKPPLHHSVYDSWENISSPSVSSDGEWVSYSVNPQQGDGWLHFFDFESATRDSIARGTRAVFSPGSEYIAYLVTPSYAETRAAKKKKLKEDKLPKNSLEIRVLTSGKVTTIPCVKSFAVPDEDSQWMAYLLEKKTEEKNDTARVADTVKTETGKSQGKQKKPEPKGSELVIINPLTEKEFRFNDVTEYSVAAKGKSIAFLQDLPDTSKVSEVRVSVFDTRKETITTILSNRGTVKKITTDNTGKLISFLYSEDTSKIKIYGLWLSEERAMAQKVADDATQALPSGWSVSENGNIWFSENGARLFFGTARKPVKEPEDTLLDGEKYKLDIWSWNDDLLQPMQKKQLDQVIQRSYQAVYHIDRKKIFQLADSAIPTLRTFRKGNSDFALASSDLKYRKASSWDLRNYTDYYLVNIETGERRLVFENTPSQVFLSPSGNYFLAYDYELKGWMSVASQGGEKSFLTATVSVSFWNELNDTPSEPGPYGLAGWYDDERHAIVYDRYDLWLLDMSGKEDPVNITNGYGRKNNLRLRYMKLDTDADYIKRKETLYLSAFKNETKESGYLSLKQGKINDPEVILLEKASLSGNITRAKKSDAVIFQKQTFAVSPELYATDLSFKTIKRISVTNPQQVNFNWISAELVEWMSLDNTRLQGILYKPENFDASAKYPMIVYFYERSSDGLYTYIRPAPSASIINRTFAASNGYLVFVPDIPYRVGYPGQSCYDAVVSGTRALLERYDFIDRERVGLDGQSWGGYQIAWLVTRTDMFACAFAGAPVSNMTSAYGGIRWETGMSRMFQYEQSQSRIGGTLWEKPLLYIENSPIFYVPKINTPLLLMHNDADGAVPWYQGIELMTALRRLEKPAWMLSYNDEAHNLTKRPNAKDLSIRKMQFFDHYLKLAPMPYWMKYGISQEQKGKIDGYDLINE